jgi:hypothetical protein
MTRSDLYRLAATVGLTILAFVVLFAQLSQRAALIAVGLALCALWVLLSGDDILDPPRGGQHKTKNE